MDPIPDDDRRFLDGNIESIDQLEILRVLAEAPEREWDIDGLARAIQATPGNAAAALDALAAQGLVTVDRQAAAVRARHGPRTAELSEALSRLLALYRERPVTLIRLVYARANERLRAFSDAFRLRKER